MRTGRGDLTLAFALATLVLAGVVGQAHGAEISSVSSDKPVYHPGDIATLTAVVYANNSTLQDVQVVVNCPSLASCPLGGQVVGGIVAPPGIPPQLTMRGTANITQGQSETFTGEIQIGQVPAGNYTIQFNAVGPANKSHVQPTYAVDSLTIEVSKASASTGGPAISTAEAALILAALVVIVLFLAVRGLRKRKRLSTFN